MDLAGLIGFHSRISKTDVAVFIAAAGVGVVTAPVYYAIKFGKWFGKKVKSEVVDKVDQEKEKEN